MMQVVLIFLLGLGVLAGALVLNAIASFFGLSNWYDFLKNPSHTSFVSYLWLFVVYPAGLGVVAYCVAKLLSL